MTKESKGWLIGLIVCIVLTCISYNIASIESQKSIKNYDYSQIEQYKGVIIEQVHRDDGFTECVELETGNVVYIGVGGEIDKDRLYTEVTVYTNKEHSIWGYSENVVAGWDTGEIGYYLPVFFFGTGIFFCLVQFCSVLNEKGKR